MDNGIMFFFSVTSNTRQVIYTSKTKKHKQTNRQTNTNKQKHHLPIVAPTIHMAKIFKKRI